VVWLNESEFIQQLHQGQCGIYPTDTVPGLGALPAFAEQIYTLKGRERGKPLILLGASVEQLHPLCAVWEPLWEPIMAQYWPGALTLVLPASPLVPVLMQQEGYVGVRIPQHPAALALLTKTGPLATTSVNRSGQTPLLDPAHIQQTFPELGLLVADYAQIGIPSTVLRWNSPGWTVLRQGAIPWPPSPNG